MVPPFQFGKDSYMNIKSTLVFLAALVCGFVVRVGLNQTLNSLPAGNTHGFAAHQNSIDVQSNSGVELQRRNTNISWPPVVGHRFPDITLRDTTGTPEQLSRYAGKVLLIEPIGVACKACQAFSGGHEIGGAFGHRPQPGLRSIHEYVEHYGKGASLNDDDIVSIHILFYGNDGRSAPTLEEAQTWSDHFGKHAPRTVFLYADQSFVNSQTRSMIPGFLLIDRDFVLRSAAGNPPMADLYRELIPMIREVL